MTPRPAARPPARPGGRPRVTLPRLTPQQKARLGAALDALLARYRPPQECP